MNSLHHVQKIARMAILAAGACIIWRADAFPPSPPHIIHGMVRDEAGSPLSIASAQVVLETTNGLSLSCQVQPGIQPGENYRLIVPMDAGVAADAYKPGALRATIPFRLKVKIGATTYLPIEMAGNTASLGQPAGSTLLNLTLGVDSDGDGLPDAWELALIQMLGGGRTLQDINPNGDADGDGISNYNEYISGTYAFDPADGLKLSLVRRPGQGPVVQWFAIGGRTYTLRGTTNMVNWTQLSFRVPPGASDSVPVQEYYAVGEQITEAEVILPGDVPPALFFRIQVR